MEADLLAAIYAAPDDDAPRLVYADWLEQRGDPRGEFIALQLAGKDAGALLGEHGARWLGDLPATDVTWARGFPVAGRPLPDADPRDPRWRTFASLAGTSILRDEVELPALRELRELRDPEIAVLVRLTRPLAVTAIQWNPVSIGRASPDTMLHDLACLPALRRLEFGDRRYGIYASMLASVLAPACFARIDELATFSDLSELGAWCEIRALPPGRPLLQRITLTEDGLRVTISRDATHRLSRLEIVADPPAPRLAQSKFRDFGEGLLAGLGSVSPTQLTHVRTRVPATFHARLAERLRKQVRLAGVETF